MNEPIGTKVEDEVLPEGEIVEMDYEIPAHAHGQTDATIPEPKEEPEDVLASDYLIGNTRQDDELFCDYRCRIWWEKRLLDRYLWGRTVWVGAQRGSAHNMERKTKDSKLRRKKDLQQERKRAHDYACGRRTPEQVKYWERKRKQAKKRQARFLA